MLSRRSFLSTTSLIAPLLALAGPARAFSLEAGTAGARQAYLSGAACTDAANHAALAANWKAALADMHLSPDQEAELMRTLTCPICGCPVAFLPPAEGVR